MHPSLILIDFSTNITKNVRILPQRSDSTSLYSAANTALHHVFLFISDSQEQLEGVNNSEICSTLKTHHMLHQILQQ